MAQTCKFEHPLSWVARLAAIPPGNASLRWGAGTMDEYRPCWMRGIHTPEHRSPSKSWFRHTLQQCSRAFQWMSMAWTVFAVATDSQVFSATRTLASLHTAVSDASSWSSIDWWPSGTLHTCQIGSGGAFKGRRPVSWVIWLTSIPMQCNGTF